MSQRVFLNGEYMRCCLYGLSCEVGVGCELMLFEALLNFGHLVQLLIICEFYKQLSLSYYVFN